MGIKLSDKERENWISNAHLIEDHCMREEYDRYMKFIGSKSGVTCGGVTGYAESKGYYPVMVNGLSYWVDDIEVYEEGLQAEANIEMEEESLNENGEDDEEDE